MMVTKLLRLTLLSFSFAFIVTAAAGPLVAIVACAGVLIYPLAKARRDGSRRAEAAQTDAAESDAAAAAEAVIEEAEAVIAAARLRLFGEAAS
jgi:parvulin-like peptidyl-prolyl isomerase